MQIAALADTHGRPFTIPPCDVFIHAGDMTGHGTLEETIDFAARLSDYIHTRTVRRALIVPGNHDKCFHEHPAAVKRIFDHCGGLLSDTTDHVHILIDSGIEIVIPVEVGEPGASAGSREQKARVESRRDSHLEKRTFWGSPWTPPFFNWSFMATEDKLAEIYEAVPRNLDVLITHGPPWGILDPSSSRGHAGSHALLAAVQVRKPHHHVFGHLHGAGGESLAYVHLGLQDQPQTNHYNVAAVDEAYNLVRGCLEFEI